MLAFISYPVSLDSDCFETRFYVFQTFSAVSARTSIRITTSPTYSTVWNAKRNHFDEKSRSRSCSFFHPVISLTMQQKEQPLPSKTAGPSTPKPDYANIDRDPIQATFMHLFRRKMEQELKSTSSLQGYDAIVDLTQQLSVKNERRPQDMQASSKRIISSLFPSFLPPMFAAMFSRPMPVFSSRMNALVTAWSTRWLMGPSEVNENGLGLKVERCRYLEETGCLSVCVNGCKLPTQQFFKEDMGLDLWMEPNLDDYSCQFHFGQTPPLRQDEDVFHRPCLQSCPSALVSRNTDVPCPPANVSKEPKNLT